MIDLHLHSRASDGALTPAALVALAQSRGVTLMSLTDHDTLDGLAAAREAAVGSGLRFIDGVEISATWEKLTLHVLGLDVDPEAPALKTGLARLQGVRRGRAEEIGRRLEARGIAGAYAGAAALADGAELTRTHFARFLAAHGHVKDEQQAYKHYLGQGKAAHVSVSWAGLGECVEWVHGAGGQAVLAHPLRYGLTRSKLTKALEAFKAAGGDGMEVISGRYNKDEFHVAGEFARRFGLAGSLGSDFHAPAPYSQPGIEVQLPDKVTAVWERFGS